MNDILLLNNDLKNYLDSSTAQMLKDLKSILQADSISYKTDKTKSDIAALYFEYEYDYIDIVFWAIDKKGEIISDTKILPTQKNSKSEEKSQWNAFIPEQIWDTVADFEDNYEEDDLDDILDEYNDTKYKIFEDWFCACWKKATTETGIQIDAYFSVHDTIFKTDLNSLEEIKEDEIEKRYK